MSVYTVYRTTNVTNGMFYIGVHKTKDPNDDYLGSGKRLKYAIKKYGIENFRKEVLFAFSTPEEAYSKEKELITEDVLDSGKCYNLKLGGDGGWDFVNKNFLSVPIQVQIEKNPLIREKSFVLSRIGKAKWINENPIEHKNIMDKANEARKTKYPDGNWKGKKHTDESRELMKNSAKGKHEGSKNSQFGTMWITNGVLNKKIKKDQEIPSGWYKGLKINVS